MPGGGPILRPGGGYAGPVPRTSSRPPGLTVAALSTLALAAFFVVMAVLSLASGHGAFSTGVALALLLWAVVTAGVGVALWRGARWARGPVVAAGLLHVFAFGQFVPSAPWAALGALAGLAATVGPVLPASRAWLSAGR